MMAKTAIKQCSNKGCHAPQTTDKYCRLHYIGAWQKKHDKKEIAKEKMLDNYVAAITKRYPEQYLDIIKRDLSSTERFKKTLEELDLGGNLDDEIVAEYQDILGKLKNGDE